MTLSGIEGARIHISGVVQGVGFRPFVYQIALRSSLMGWVRNTSAGVDIEVDGSHEALKEFVEALEEETPPLAKIDEIQVEWQPAIGFSSFEIIPSEHIPGAFQPISPDVSLCEGCRKELHDPADRRFRYPFINCTNCGPRFTIISDIPYDRPNTTMAGFDMCDACLVEYRDPLDRRYHAQPVACPDCGPEIWLEINGETVAKRGEALNSARRMLKDGKILAVKGLGGFHLACDATNPRAVVELRRRKLRVDKAFAVMLYDMESVHENAFVDSVSEGLLISPERPIVIANRKPDSSIVAEVAPHQSTLGLMLPYTPLHELLLEPEDGYPGALVMTSGNLSEEPIATDNDEARRCLDSLADGFLLHNRDIQTRCDDSIMRVFEEGPYPIRRSRGYAPFPMHLQRVAPPMLAVGGELKNTFCLAKDTYAFLSQHIGDMENYETLRSFEQGITHFEGIYKIQPEIIVHDDHPDYMSTHYALDRAKHDGIMCMGVQHHHAHIAACMAENEIQGPVIGLSFDGTGYGLDGTTWGGEILLADYGTFTRFCHLREVPMPGGDKAVRNPDRLALAWLHSLGIEWDVDLPPVIATAEEERKVILRQIETGLNAPRTSSMGRLFDAVAALIGIRGIVNYEAQAAIELEACVNTEERGAYNFDFQEDELDPVNVFPELIQDLREGVSKGIMAAKFHHGLVQAVLDVCHRVKNERGITDVALSGGVWQNLVLLSNATKALRSAGFNVLVHRKVPANDGALAFGQVVVALHNLNGVPMDEVPSEAQI